MFPFQGAGGCRKDNHWKPTSGDEVLVCGMKIALESEAVSQSISENGFGGSFLHGSCDNIGMVSTSDLPCTQRQNELNYSVSVL